jgi:hypothetical protein
LHQGLSQTPESRQGDRPDQEEVGGTTLVKIGVGGIGGRR